MIIRIQLDETERALLLREDKEQELGTTSYGAQTFTDLRSFLRAVKDLEQEKCKVPAIFEGEFIAGVVSVEPHPDQYLVELVLNGSFRKFKRNS